MNETCSQICQWKKIVLRLLNMACFYGGWFICMHEAVGPTPLFGPLVVFVIILYHMVNTDSFWVDAALILTLAGVGTLIDSIYIWTGLIHFEGGYACCPYIAPLWITALWGLYATSVNHSLDWMKLHCFLIGAPMGAGGAISSYLVGAKLGAATFPHSMILGLAVIGGVWSLAVPLSLIYSDWLQKRIGR